MQKVQYPFALLPLRLPVRDALLCFDVDVRVACLLESLVGFANPSPSHHLIGLAVVEVDGQVLLPLRQRAAREQMPDDANEASQHAGVRQRTVQGGAAPLGSAAEEDPRGIAAQQLDLPIQDAEDAVPGLPQALALQHVLAFPIVVCLVIVPRVLLASVVSCDRNGLGCGQRHLQAQVRQLRLTEEVMRLPIHIVRPVQAELVQVDNCELMPLPPWPEHGLAVRVVWVVTLRLHCRGPCSVELVRVQRLPAPQRG
mmetsp:Transcript_43358/g.139328  ORF Transcript_43358/g.139328 Transcript_43358/m.139328 type:complete len:255 (-) Transcript_43358:380-1144(-)